MSSLHSRLDFDKELVLVISSMAILSMIFLMQRTRVLQAAEIPHSRFRHHVSVADSIGMTRTTDWIPARFSPDGKHFVIVLKNGNLKQNTNEYSVLLWKTSDVFKSTTPELLLKMSSSSNREGIEDVTWLDDSATFMFLGEHPGELHQLYTFNVRSHVLKQITRHPTSVHAYSADPKGKYFSYLAEEPSRKLWNSQTLREGITVSTEPLPKLMQGETGGEDDSRGQLFYGSPRNRSRQLTTQDKIDFGSKPVVSPDGNYVVLATLVTAVPKNWREYLNPDIQRESSAQRGRGLTGFIRRFELIDTISGTSKPLLDSPAGTSGSEVAWAPDSRSVIITRVFLPLDNTEGDDREARKSHTFTVEVTPSTGEIAKISQEDLYGADWNLVTNRLCSHAMRLESSTFFGLNESVCFQKRGGKWEQLQSLPSDESIPDIVVEEDMNTPPNLVAVDRTTRRKYLLLDLNPHFKQLQLAKVEEIEWNGTDGHPLTGGLYYPVEYVPGKRYPLVIQTHGWSRKRFMIDGPYNTGSAAQALASQNMFVLQADDGNLLSRDTPDEAPREAAGYEDAIDYLDQMGLIDHRRVGIEGFSRSCLFIKFALTHSKFTFAAASVADGIDAGYFQYIAFSNTYADVPEEAEKLNAGQPWGKGLAPWSRQSPGFNLDKVETPLRILALDPRSVLGEWEWFAGLTRLGKPVEMIYLHDGAHDLVRPWDRMISQQGNVDWFRFWLKGEEDSDPAKAEQYARWRELRKLQEQNEKKPASESVSR